MKKGITYLLLLLLVAACAPSSENIEINGQFFGRGKQTVILEQLSPTGSAIIDSTRTSDDGSFSLQIDKTPQIPTFYNLYLGDSYVPLLLEDGEKVTVSAVGNIFNNYNVEGSQGSLLIREFNTLLRDATLELDSLMTIYEASDDNQVMQQEIGREYGQKYIRLKRDVIKFVIGNANSLAALLPLYHPNANGEYIFDQPEDYIYFQLVSDSLMAKYPTSPYALSMKKDMQLITNAQHTDSLLASLDESSFPEIEMYDASGKLQKLSDNLGKVILIDFTASEPTELKILNRELVELYEKVNNSDFVVYQIWLDANKAQWLKSVSDSRLPWISVNDFMGSSSPVVRTYNINKIPANYLINQQGDIVARDLNVDELEKMLEGLL